MQQLRPVQAEALAYATGRKRIALFMEMRLGKTRTAIEWLKANECRSNLIVAPYQTHEDWKNELKICGREGVAIQKLRQREILWELGAPEGWVLMGYEGIRADPDLLRLGWDSITLDESVQICKPTSKQSKYLTNFCQHIEYRACLSGLPNPEDSLEFFQQYKFLFGGMLGCKNWWQFRERFYQQRGFDWYPKAGTIDAIQRWNDARAFIRTRAQAGYVEKREYLTVRVRPPETIKRAHDRALELFSQELGNGKEKWTNYAPVASTWASQLAGGFDVKGRLVSAHKFVAMVRYAQTHCVGQQIVCWFRFNNELTTAVKFFKRAGITAVQVVGTDKREARSLAINDFKSGKYKVICVQSKLGRYSLNFSNANWVFYYSNPWDYDTRKQSEDRVVMPEKTGTIRVVDFLTVGTVDEDLYAAIGARGEKRLDAKIFQRRLRAAVLRRSYGKSSDS